MVNSLIGMCKVIACIITKSTHLIDAESGKKSALSSYKALYDFLFPVCGFLMNQNFGFLSH